MKKPAASRRHRAVAVAALFAALLLLATPASAAAPTITVGLACTPNTGCTFEPRGYLLGVGENPTFSIAADAQPSGFQFHDVTAKEKGPDGRPLFRSAVIGPGKATLVEGTEYLPPGGYPFICSIHKDQLPPMKGKLVVVDEGRTPVVRPRVDVSLPDQPFLRIRARGLLTVSVQADQPLDAVLLVARVAGRRLGSLAGLSVEPGVRQQVQLELRGASWRALREAPSVLISVLGAPRFGVADTARRAFR